MRKRVFGRRLSREKDTRLALFRSMARSLFINGKINTTRAKALAVMPYVEKVLKKTIEAKDFSKRKNVFAMLANDKRLLEVIFTKVNKEFNLTKKLVSFTPLPDRQGDNARMVRLSLVEGVFLTKPIDVVKKTAKKTKKVKSVKKETTEDKKSKKK